MMQDIGAPQISQAKVLRIVWSAMAVSTFVYLGLAPVADRHPPPNLPDAWRGGTLLNVCYAAAIALFAAALLLKPRSAAASSAPFVRSLVIFGACELIGALGFVLYWLTRERDAFYLLLATSLAGLVIHRPRMCRGDFK